MNLLIFIKKLTIYMPDETLQVAMCMYDPANHLKEQLYCYSNLAIYVVHMRYHMPATGIRNFMKVASCGLVTSYLIAVLTTKIFTRSQLLPWSCPQRI